MGLTCQHPLDLTASGSLATKAPRHQDVLVGLQRKPVSITDMLVGILTALKRVEGWKSDTRQIQ